MMNLLDFYETKGNLSIIPKVALKSILNGEPVVYLYLSNHNVDKIERIVNFLISNCDGKVLCQEEH